MSFPTIERKTEGERERGREEKRERKGEREKENSKLSLIQAIHINRNSVLHKKPEARDSR